VVMGAALGAVGFYLLAGKLTDLSLSHQSFYIALAGAGLGLMLGTASTDAVNRAPSGSFSEVTGVTQTARNFFACLGLAVLGALLIDANRTTFAHQPARMAFAHSTQPIFYIMAGVLAATFLVTLRWLPRGRVEPVATPVAEGAPG